MSAADYDSMMETLRVYQNPYLRNKITHGLEQVRQGQVQEHALLDGDGSGASA
jgi:antitoxin YefM